MCLTASPTQLLSGNENAARFALAFGQTETDAGTEFPASNLNSDIGFRLTAALGSALIYVKNVAADLGTYDSTVTISDAVGRTYQVAVTLAITSFDAGEGLSASLFVNGIQVGSSVGSTWDTESVIGGQNFISLSAIDGGWAADDLRIFAGVSSTCGA